MDVGRCLGGMRHDKLPVFLIGMAKVGVVVFERQVNRFYLDACFRKKIVGIVFFHDNLLVFAAFGGMFGVVFTFAGLIDADAQKSEGCFAVALMNG
jgi:hypothetical protein